MAKEGKVLNLRNEGPLQPEDVRVHGHEELGLAVRRDDHHRRRTRSADHEPRAGVVGHIKLLTAVNCDAIGVLPLVLT